MGELFILIVEYVAGFILAGSIFAFLCFAVGTGTGYFHGFVVDRDRGDGVI